jgi:hypothetical protein
MSETSRITQVSWGRIEVTIGDHAAWFKDCKVWPGGARIWDWRETGTHHQPGIQPADIEEILNQGVEVLILSRGMELKLATSPETRHFLHQRGVEFHVEETRRAVELFNEEVERGRKVGGIFHSTC